MKTARTPAELREVAAGYRRDAERALRVNMHDRRFYLERAEVHEQAALAAEAALAEVRS